MTDRQAEAPSFDTVVDLGAAFDAEIPGDLLDYPWPVVISPTIITAHANARMVRLTLKVAAKAGRKGISLQLLREVYQALGVPARLAELIERKLTADRVGHVSCGRLYIAPAAGSWDRLATEKAS